MPGLYRLQNSISRPIAENTTTEKRINSFFGGATLGWKNALYLDLTGRQDWSSALPDDANGYFYPSASVSWVFSEMMKIPSLSFGKARLGWASVGGDTDPYNIFLAYGSDPNFGNLPSYFLPNRLNNSGLRPEKTRSVEGGLDLRFFQNRLGLDLTAYSGTTTDQIVPLATSAATGYVQQFINTGEISNRGIEIEFSATPVRRGAFSWDFGLNFGKNVNRVVSLIPDDPSIKSLPLADAIFGGASVHAQIGQPYGTILGTNYLFDDAGNRLVGPDGFYLTSPGIMPIGNITPDFTGGATNTFSFKNWSLRVFIDVRKGGDIFSVTNMWGRYSGLFEATAEGDDREKGELNAGVIAEVDADGLPIQTGGQATDDLRDDTYKSTGKTNDVRANSYANRFAAGGYVLNAADVYDGSFIKLREVSLGWSLPKKWLGKGHFQSASISVVGRNLAILFKNLPNLDPDMAIHTGNVQGLEGGAGPTTRSLGVNLNLKF